MFCKTACVELHKNYSYQHLQGIMLVNLNYLAYKYRLSHSEYRIMGLLIGFWNMKSLKSSPTMKLLAQFSGMSNSTIFSVLNKLLSNSLVMIKKEGRKNYYYINLEKLLPDIIRKKPLQPVLPNATSCSTTNKTKKEYKNIYHLRLIYHKNKKNDDFKNIFQNLVVKKYNQLEERKLFLPETRL